MLKQIFISAILIVGLFSSSALAQQSAQASMKVSVEVVEGASIAMNQPDKVSLSQNSDSILGAMRLQGSNNTLVNVSNKLQLFNANGTRLNLDITAINDIETNPGHISFQGTTSQQDSEKGTYSGELRATVEYL